MWLDGPHGDMTTDGRRAGAVMVASGIGITPMMSMLRTLAARGDSRSVRVILADTPDEAVFRDELRSLRDRMVSMDVREVGRVAITARILDPLLPEDRFVRGRLDYFVCGSPRMVGATVSALTALGIPARRIHTELFDIG